MSEPTPAELMAALARVESHLDERRRPNSEMMAALARLEARGDQRHAELSAELNRRFDNLKFVHQDVWHQYVTLTDRRLQAIEADIEASQNRLRDNTRVVFISLIFPVLVAIIGAALLTTGGN